MLKRVISFSLWGSNPIYWQGAKANIQLAASLYPGWICRFYIGSDATEQQRTLLLADNSETVVMKQLHPFEGLFWRFTAAADADVMISRDCDSRISEREVTAVNAWLKSDKDFHIMRDHPYHREVILGGMWGSRNGILKDFDWNGSFERWRKSDDKGWDQDFLKQEIYPLVVHTALEHSEYPYVYSNPVEPFPVPRRAFEFVGEIFDERGRRHPWHWKMVRNPSYLPFRYRIRRALGALRRRILP